MYRRWPFYAALLIPAIICSVTNAPARERPAYCYPPGVSIVARGVVVGGKLCNGAWGCRCAHWFCPQCSIMPAGPLACEWTACEPLSRPPIRAR
jgi:hypothetical protein